MKVQSGQDVTLQCKNTFKYASDSVWYRIVNSTKLVCISSVTKSDLSTLKYCDGLQSGKFEMSTNISTVSLKIKQVDLSDSGLYYCGIYTKDLPVFTEICLNIEGKIIVKSCILFGTHYLLIYVYTVNIFHDYLTT